MWSKKEASAKTLWCQVSRVFGLAATEQDIDDVRELLRRRLLIVAIMGLLLIFSVIVRVMIDATVVYKYEKTLNFIFSGLCIALCSAVYILWRRRTLSMFSLRSIEVMLS